MISIIHVYLGLSVILCILIAILSYNSTSHFLVKLLVLPWTIATSILSIYTILYFAGSPIQKYPKGEWEYIHHTMTDAGKSVALWVWSKDYDDFRLFIFPYERNQQKKLKEAQDKTKAGGRSKGRFELNNGEVLLRMEDGSPLDSKNPVK